MSSRRKGALVLCCVFSLGCGQVERDSDSSDTNPGWLVYKVSGDGPGAQHSSVFAVRPDDAGGALALVEAAPWADFAWSPVEPVLALAIHGPETGLHTLELLRFDAMGVAERQTLPSAPGEFPHVEFSPDGRFVSVDSGGLRVLDATAPLEWRLISDSGVNGYEWSPTSEHLASWITHDDGTKHLYLAGAPTFEPHLVLLPEGAHSPNAPTAPSGGETKPSAWSPDGERIAFTARLSDAEGGIGSNRLFVAGAGTVEFAVLASPELNSLHTSAGSPAWSPVDGRFLVYRDTEPSQSTPLTLGRFVVSVGPDGIGWPEQLAGNGDEVRWVSSHESLVLTSKPKQSTVTLKDVQDFPEIATDDLLELDMPCEEGTLRDSPPRALLSCTLDPKSRSLVLWDSTRPSARLDYAANFISLGDTGWSPNGEHFAFLARSAQGSPSHLFVAQLSSNRVDDHGEAKGWKQEDSGPWNADGSALFYRLPLGRLGVLMPGAPSHAFVLGAEPESIGRARWQRAL